MKRLIILAMVAQVQASDLYVGAGTAFNVDRLKPVFSVSYQESFFNYNITHFTEYKKTTPAIWVREALPPVDLGLRAFKSEAHQVYTVTGRVFKFTTAFFDTGVSYSSKTSITNSSHLLFNLKLGVETEDFRLYLAHTSNAGLKGVNYGENSLVLEYKL